MSAEPTEISASINLLGHYGLEHSYNKYFGKKVKEELSSFLPHLPGNIDTPGIQDNRCASNLVIVLLLTPSLLHLPGNIDTPGIRDNRCASNLVIVLTPSLLHLPGNIDTPGIRDNRCASIVVTWL